MASWALSHIPSKCLVRYEQNTVPYLKNLRKYYIQYCSYDSEEQLQSLPLSVSTPFNGNTKGMEQTSHFTEFTPNNTQVGLCTPYNCFPHSDQMIFGVRRCSRVNIYINICQAMVHNCSYYSNKNMVSYVFLMCFECF